MMGIVGINVPVIVIQYLDHRIVMTGSTDWPRDSKFDQNVV